jgi:hypothetical protein
VPQLPAASKASAQRAILETESARRIMAVICPDYVSRSRSGPYHEGPIAGLGSYTGRCAQAMTLPLNSGDRGRRERPALAMRQRRGRVAFRGRFSSAAARAGGDARDPRTGGRGLRRDLGHDSVPAPGSHRLVTVGEDAGVRIWDVGASRLPQPVLSDAPSRSVDWSGQTIALAVDDHVMLISERDS